MLWFIAGNTNSCCQRMMSVVKKDRITPQESPTMVANQVI